MENYKSSHTEASAGDDIIDLVQDIENLTKDDAIAQLLELEERHEKTFFEIGGVLSAIQKHKWFDPFASLDEWVEKNTALSRSKARALIQIYDAVVTKLNAIAGLLDASNADHWIEAASIRSRAEIKQLVQKHLGGSAGRKPDESSRLDDFGPDEQTFCWPVAPRRGNPRVDRGPKIGALVRIEAAQIVGENLDQRIGRQGSSPVGISLTDDCERRRVVLHAGNIFGPVDRGLDHFDLIVPELEGLDPCGGRTRAGSSSRPDAGPYDDFLQIDAPVNQGNSGSPTFNAQGEVVGVDTAIFSPSGGSVGIGSAVASDLAKGVVQQLKDNGKVARGWLGVQPMTQDIADSLGLKDAEGAIVGKVVNDSPAAAAGLKEGDVIASVNGKSVADWDDLAQKIAALGPKKDAELTIIRNGSPQTVKVTLGAPPDDKQAQADANSQGSSLKDAMAK